MVDFKNDALATIRKTLRQILNDTDSYCEVFNVFAIEPSKGPESLINHRGIININRPENETDRPLYIVTLVNISSGKSESFVLVGGDDEESDLAELTRRVWDLIVKLNWEVATYLENHAAVYVTTDAVKWFKGVGYYLTLAEKLMGKEYYAENTPSYEKSDLMEKAVKLLYLQSQEGISNLEARIDDYLDMKSLLED